MLHATRNRNKPNSVTVHGGLMPRARLEQSDFLDRTPIKERAGWRWAVFFFFRKNPLIPSSYDKSVLNSVNFEINKVYFHKQGQIFKPSAVANRLPNFPWLIPSPPPPRTYTPPPGTFSGLYVLVLCLLVYAILSRDLHDYSSQLWILRCNMPSHSDIHWGERRDSLRFDTSTKYSTKITLFKFLVTKRKTENVGLRFFYQE